MNLSSDANLKQEKEFMDLDQDRTTEVDTLELFRYFFKKMPVIILITIVFAVLMTTYSFFIVQPKYEATAKIHVNSVSDSSLVHDYQEILKIWEIDAKVIKNLDLNYTIKEMQEMMTVVNPKDTRVIYIKIKTPNANQSALIANEYAKVMIKHIKNKMETEEPSLFSSALKPSEPISPNKRLNILAGVLAGLFTALLYLTVRYLLTVEKKKS